MNLETKSKELKDILATYEAQWLPGYLSSVIHAGTNSTHRSQPCKRAKTFLLTIFQRGILFVALDKKTYG